MTIINQKYVKYLIKTYLKKNNLTHQVFVNKLNQQLSGFTSKVPVDYYNLDWLHGRLYDPDKNFSSELDRKVISNVICNNPNQFNSLLLPNFQALNFLELQELKLIDDKVNKKINTNLVFHTIGKISNKTASLRDYHAAISLVIVSQSGTTTGLRQGAKCRLQFLRKTPLSKEIDILIQDSPLLNSVRDTMPSEGSSYTNTHIALCRLIIKELLGFRLNKK